MSKRKFTYEYPHPSVTVDAVVFGLNLETGVLHVLLVERGDEPYKGCYALHGGFVLENEDLDEAILRELREETACQDLYLEQLCAVGTAGRDPRGWVITVAYYALIRPEQQVIVGGDDAVSANWFSVGELPPLAFDHASILNLALARLRSKLAYQAISSELLPEKFTMRQLRKAYEIVLGRQLDDRNFRKKMRELGCLKPLNEEYRDTRRAAKLYSFTARNLVKGEK